MKTLLTKVFQIFCFNYKFVLPARQVWKFGHTIVFVWSEKLGANQNNRRKAMFGTRNKIMRVEQLVDPTNDYLRSSLTNVPQPKEWYLE